LAGSASRKSAAGKAAQTEYEVLEYAEDNTARVRLKPITGRSHQLRVHAEGHRVAVGGVGDGERLGVKQQARGHRQRLRRGVKAVHMLALGHPILGDRFYATPEALAMAPRLLLHAETAFPGSRALPGRS
jgi:tRNA pseudouridine32 synthase/23S rRNA pseudouridine746 synthase